jgi:two-component system sensor histidine kinase KdpD
LRALTSWWWDTLHVGRRSHRFDRDVHARNVHHLFELSELLLPERPLDELGQLIVQAVKDIFALNGVTLLVSGGEHLEVLASTETPIAAEEIANIHPGAQAPVRLSTGAPNETVHTLALAASGRPIGLLVMTGMLADSPLRDLLPTVANNLALALERAQLSERARRAEILEEVDRLRRALVGAVSHDLRTPLATIKVASTTLLDRSDRLSDDDSNELYGLIDLQADRLTRLVLSLLDMTRLEAGTLQVGKDQWSVLDLVGEAVATTRPLLGDRQVDIELPEDLPDVQVDHLLIGQVLARLLENADRHGPPGTTIKIGAEAAGQGVVSLSVTDRGTGLPPGERESVFDSFVRFDTGGRAGLGLTLCKAFVEAHGGRIWAEQAPGGGARFVFTLPAVMTEPSRR